MIAFLVLSAVLATVSASYVPVPADTPEVAHAKAEHLAIVEQTKLRNAHGASAYYGGYGAPYAYGAYGAYGAPYAYGAYGAPYAPGPIPDEPEVAAAKAKHLAIQAAEAARNQAGVAYGYAPYAAYAPYDAYGAYGAYGGYGAYSGYGAPVVVNGQVQDTPEVAAAKAKHFAAYHEAEARAAHAY